MPNDPDQAEADLFGDLPVNRRPDSPSLKPTEEEKQLFDWSSWQTKLPPLKPHSVAKLNVLRSYIEDYICILCTGNPGQDRFRLTLVDGKPVSNRV